MINADLHSHSTASDGKLTPSEVAYRAFQNGVSLWSLTDHDNLSGQQEAKQIAEQHGMQYISGIEISATWCQKTIHIVGLGIDVHHQPLIDSLSQLTSNRAQRAYAIGQALAEVGIPNAYEGALKYVSNIELISRTHFARYLVELGYAKSIHEVFNHFLVKNKPGYVPQYWAALEEVVSWIHQAKGVAVLAHPGRYQYTPLQYDVLFKAFFDLGGEAIEIVTGSHTVDQYQEYAQVAKRFGFEGSRGSDFHGLNEGRCDLGILPDLPKEIKPVWWRWI